MKFSEQPYIKSPEARPENQGSMPSRIILHFTRHAEKGQDPALNNYEQLMTKTGRQQGLDKGENRGKVYPTAVAVGSRITRSKEMAGFEMAGAQQREDITSADSLTELEQKLDQDLKFGSKLGVDSRLGFYYQPEMDQAVRKAYKAGRGLEFIINESDVFAQQRGDRESTTYSRVSANVAEFIRKYMAVAPRFNKLLEDEGKKKKYGEILERFIGSHAGVMDVFLCKIIEKIKGADERDKFVYSLTDQMFDYAEGFEIEINNLSNEAEPQVRIIYAKTDEENKKIFEFDEIIPLATIEEIIKERS